jgi:small subunit ribosomal protein S18
MSKKLKIKLSTRLLSRKLKKQGSSTRRRCRFCVSPQAKAELNYKNVDLLKTFLTERGKILPSRVSGNSAKCQRVLSREIKLARTMAMLPFCSISSL